MIDFNEKKGITFIGMPSSGKSTVGNFLAKKLNWNYVDLDKLIFEKEGIHHNEILKQKGEKALKSLEEKHALELNFDNLVFAPPGSIIFSPSAMEKIKKESVVIHLGVSPEEIKRRLGDNLYKDGIIGLETKGLSRIISERLPLYEKYADFYIDTSSLNPQMVMDIVLEILDKKNNDIILISDKRAVVYR